MMGVITFLCGVGLGVCSAAVVWLVARETRPPWPVRALPPATPRAIARVRRSNRADIRAALARHGVKLRDEPPPVVSTHDKRQWIPAPVDDFTDDQETR